MTQGQVKHPQTDGRLKENKDEPSNNRQGARDSRNDNRDKNRR